jgi:scyllo-inositol 2-dehydrogenase (NADP+)
MIRTVVIGLGMGLNYHVPKIISHPKFELLAVSDVNPKKLELAQEKYDLIVYEDAFDMMKIEKPDLAVIASPTQFHAEHSIQAMELGIDVFLEKPMARDTHEARKIYDFQKKTGCKLMVFQPHRAFSDTITVKTVLEKGILGHVYMIKRTMSNFFIRTNWQAYKKNGGGTLNNHGSHYIDQLLYLSGGKPENVSCELLRVAATGDADDCARIMIKTDSGMVLDIEMNMVTAFSLTPWVIHGTSGTAMYTINDEGKPVIRARYYPEDVELGKSVHYKTGMINEPAEYPWIIEDFEIKDEYAINYYDICYDYYGLGKDPFVPLEDTLTVMEVLEKCHKVTGKY